MSMIINPSFTTHVSCKSVKNVFLGFSFFVFVLHSIPLFLYFFCGFFHLRLNKCVCVYLCFCMYVRMYRVCMRVVYTCLMVLDYNKLLVKRSNIGSLQ